MNETLASRVGRLVSGSANALVAAVENTAPRMVLEEAIREIERATDEVRTELGLVLAKKHLAATRFAEENKRHDDLTDKIELALRDQREDLAEAAAGRQLDIEAQIPILEATLSECGDRERELEGFVAALVARRREMEDELTTFAKSQEEHVPSDPKGTTGSVTPSSRAELASSAFDRVLARHAGLPKGRATLKDEVHLQELEDLAFRNRVRERLEAAKARMERE